jgi:uncharacterized protein (DUF2236 family)
MRAAAQQAAPHDDYGFFGPGSVTWKVFTHPASLTVAFQRTVATEVLEPFLVAAVEATGSVRSRPALRYDRTLQYVATVAFAGSEAAVRAADVLMRIHARIVGTEPISGRQYDANDPDAQLWIHLTQWHSLLYCYERFGPGPLTAAEDAQYWAECRVAAELQTIDPAAVPRSRAEMREYYARMRPVLAGTEVAQETARMILDAGGTLVDKDGSALRPLAPVMRVLMRKATIATWPRWLRRVAGVRQGRVQDAMVTALLRPAFRALHRRPAAMVALLRTVSPLTHPVLAPVLLGVPPRRSVVRTPAEAWARAGLRTPREQYAAQLVARAAVELPAQAEPDGTRPLLSFG